MDTVDLSESAPSERVLEAAVTLSEPQTRLRVRLPAGQPGRAEALFDDQSWAAKHFWREGADVVYEFDEPLPAGAITLRIPFSAR
jgi:hypothetical protein